MKRVTVGLHISKGYCRGCSFSKVTAQVRVLWGCLGYCRTVGNVIRVLVGRGNFRISTCGRA